MTKDDIELKLLCDLPIYVGDVPVHRITMNDIAKYGHSRYMEFINLITLSTESIQKILQTDRELSLFDAVFVLCCNADTSSAIRDYFSVVFGQPFTLDMNTVSLVFDGFAVSRDNFPDVVRIIRLRNGVGSDEDIDEERPANEAVRKLLERRKELRKKVAKAKSSGESHIRLVDMVSSLSICCNIPLEYIMKLDMSQLKHQLLRARSYERYHIDITALMHGAGEDIKVKDYVENIFDTKNE